jgi:hypothetical protein
LEEVREVGRKQGTALFFSGDEGGAIRKVEMALMCRFQFQLSTRLASDSITPEQLPDMRARHPLTDSDKLLAKALENLMPGREVDPVAAVVSAWADPDFFAERMNEHREIDYFWYLTFEEILSLLSEQCASSKLASEALERVYNTSVVWPPSSAGFLVGISTFTPPEALAIYALGVLGNQETRGLLGDYCTNGDDASHRLRAEVALQASHQSFHSIREEAEGYLGETNKERLRGEVRNLKEEAGNLDASLRGRYTTIGNLIYSTWREGSAPQLGDVLAEVLTTERQLAELEERRDELSNQPLPSGLLKRLMARGRGLAVQAKIELDKHSLESKRREALGNVGRTVVEKHAEKNGLPQDLEGPVGEALKERTRLATVQRRLKNFQSVG